MNVNSSLFRSRYLSFVVLGFLVGTVAILAIARSVWASEEHSSTGMTQSNGPDPCSGDCCVAAGNGPGGPGSGGPGPGGFGGGGGPYAAATPKPVYLMRGSVIESVTDLSIPGPLGGWKHHRTYDSLLEPRSAQNRLYNIHGRRWVGGPQMMYLRKNGNTMELYMTASNRLLFTDNAPNQANGTYTGPTDLRATLTKSVALSYLEYTLTYPDTGEVYIFREKDPTDPCWGITGSTIGIISLSERTSTAYRTQGLDGEKHFYNAAGQVALTVTASPQSYFIKYSYVTTGLTIGCLKKVEVYDGAPDLNETTKIAEAEYTYAEAYAYHGENPVGITGDLAQVKVSELMSDGVTWDHKYTQYRSFYSYQLNAIFESDAIERILQENPSIKSPEALLNLQTNTYLVEGGKTIIEYATKEFVHTFYCPGCGPSTTAMATAWGVENLNAKYDANERPIMVYKPYGIGFVQSEKVNAGCSSCGGSGSGGTKHDFYYLLKNAVPTDAAGDPNIVIYLTIEDTRDSAGTPLFRTIYGLNWHGVELRKAVIENPNAATLNAVCTSRILAADGQILETRPAEAHALIDSNTTLAQFFAPYTGGSWANDTATLEASKGIIKITEYDPTTGKPNGYKVKVGSNGTAYYIGATDYDAQGHVAATHAYPTQTTNRSAGDRVTTTYAYTYWEDNYKQAIKTETITVAAVPVPQNGTGVAAVTQNYYDTYGKLRWSCDPLGVVTYHGCHPITLQSTLTVRDVDTAALPNIITTDTDDIAAWTGAAPFTRGGSLAAAFNQTTTTGYDLRGRAFVTTGPDGVASYTIRDVKKTMRFSAWDDTTQKPILPISVTEVNAAGKPTSVYKLPPAAVVVTSGKPSGVSSGTKVSWTRYTYDPKNGSLLYVDRYHTIPPSGDGTLGTNYYRTASIHDQQGRQIATAQYADTNKWQINAVRFDWRNRPIENFQGVTTTMPTTLANIVSGGNYASYLKTTGKAIYDGDHVAKRTTFFDTGTNDYTGVNYKYDAWDRLRGAESFSMSGGSETPFGPYSVRDYDWRGNVTASAVFETVPNWGSVITTDNFAETTTTGRRGLTKSYFDSLGAVYQTETFEVASNGVAGNSAVIDHFRDAMGREIAAERVNHPRNEVEYDTLGRQIRTLVRAGQGVVAMTEREYDVASHVVTQHQYDLHPDEVTGITTSSTNYTRRTVYSWHDKAGRQTVQADYGSGGTTWDYHATPPRPTNAPENSSMDCLVTKTVYGTNTGRAELVTDTTGRNNKTEYDALDRIITQWQNYKSGSSTKSDEDVEVRYTYDGLGNTLTLTAVNSATGNQVTRYLYEDAVNAKLQTSAIYPDSSDTNSSGTDQVKIQYCLDGNKKQTSDQNGSVRLFSYDAQRRLAADSVATLGSGVDSLVQKIGRTYTWDNAIATIASYDGSNAVLNEVKYEYGDNRKLTRIYQHHAGAVNAFTTPYIQYGYSGIEDGFRTVSIVYPSGKIVSYGYDDLGHLTTINEDNTPLVSYIHSGSGQVMQTTYEEPGVSLIYTNGGVDRYGRIVNHGWMKGSTPLVHVLHEYDFASNRTFRHETIHAANSELYQYDQINQIKNLDRGVLNSSKDTVAVSNFTEAWDFDKTGNWIQYDKNGTVENRTHNAANELQGIVTHDTNGNMVVMPGQKAKFDAWNRLVEIRDASDNLIAEYSYNGLNQRIKKKIGSVTTNSFYNDRWQELESITGSELMTYTWGLRYIDDLVLREKGAERLYSLADPNWNVVAVVDAMGAVQERMKYDAFGRITWMDRDFVPKASSELVWSRTFTGQVLDVETGLMYCRNRYYHTELGRFISRDPILYRAKDLNLVRYVHNKPIIFTDSLGTCYDHICLENCNYDYENKMRSERLTWREIEKIEKEYMECISGCGSCPPLPPPPPGPGPGGPGPGGPGPGGPGPGGPGGPGPGDPGPGFECPKEYGKRCKPVKTEYGEDACIPQVIKPPVGPIVQPIFDDFTEKSGCAMCNKNLQSVNCNACCKQVYGVDKNNNCKSRTCELGCPP